MPILDLPNQKLYYETFGSGTPLLLMHGWMQVGRSLIGLAEQLALHHRVILPDLPGYGRSVPAFRSYPVDFYHRDAQMMGAFLDALNIERAHVMGFSDGGEVALLMGVQRPGRCRSVIAWGAIGAFEQGECDHARRGLPPTWITDAHRSLHPFQSVDQWPYQWTEAFCGMVATGGDVSLSRAYEIDCPLLLMLGDHDALNPVASGRRFVNAAAERAGIYRQFEEFSGAGHSIHTDQPEQFKRVVSDFLRMAEQP